jgi:RNA polymerase sigma-70 factor, ECF subfamily
MDRGPGGRGAIPMIRDELPGHDVIVQQECSQVSRGDAAPGEEQTPGWVTGDEKRLRSVFDDHFAFVWRSLRRLGLLPQEADDGTQRVFVVAARKLDAIETGKERAFLFAAALRVASETRRARNRRAEVDEERMGERDSTSPSPEDLVDQKRKRELLDEVLDSLPEDLRTVLVLFELEGMSFTEMAELLSVPRGTIASRVRRAREQFEEQAERRMSRGLRRGGVA